MHDVPGDLFAMEREDDLNPDIRMPGMSFTCYNVIIRATEGSACVT